MTAEIAILNRDAVALAADSAVTFQDERGRKIFQSANKIFALSKHHPVGIMVYGDALFMEVPWETVIKMYRRSLGRQHFASLQEYAENFLNYLRTEPRINNPKVQREYARREVGIAFIQIRTEIDDAVKALLRLEEELTEAQIRRTAKKIVRTHRDRWNQVPTPENLPVDIASRLRTQYDEDIREIREGILGKLVTPEAAEWLNEIAVSAIVKFPPDRGEGGGASGVVFAGYGEADVFPAYISYYVDAAIESHLKMMEDDQAQVSHENPVTVRAFAQREMVFMFMEGIDPAYGETVQRFTGELLLAYPDELLKHLPLADGADTDELRRVLKRAAITLLKKYGEQLGKYRRQTYAQPIVRVMSMLPKEELASAAESLVNITSVKRRFSMQAETVGGPTDVAVISKGDGFIWIKRKHYFDPKLNPHFLATYYEAEDSHGESDDQ